jgi:hypothetical protein
MNLRQLREIYHKETCQQVLEYWPSAPNTAGVSNKRSAKLAQNILTRMGLPPWAEPPNTRGADVLFTSLTCDYMTQAFGLIEHLRPGNWIFTILENAPKFDQYEHLTDLGRILAEESSLRVILKDYFVTPDILIGRSPISDQEVNQNVQVLQSDIATLTPLRADNLPELKPFLHASIACKWMIRSDGGQTPRTEFLSLVQSRKGRLPHVVAVTAEPLPTRISSLALGTGDLDCVYHFALHELEEALAAIDNEDQMDMLRILVEGRRLRDISDLPFDLAT